MQRLDSPVTPSGPGGYFSWESHPMVRLATRVAGALGYDSEFQLVKRGLFGPKGPFEEEISKTSGILAVGVDDRHRSFAYNSFGNAHVPRSVSSINPIPTDSLGSSVVIKPTPAFENAVYTAYAHVLKNVSGSIRPRGKNYSDDADEQRVTLTRLMNLDDTDPVYTAFVNLIASVYILAHINGSDVRHYPTRLESVVDDVSNLAERFSRLAHRQEYGFYFTDMGAPAPTLSSEKQTPILFSTPTPTKKRTSTEETPPTKKSPASSLSGIRFT